MTGFQPGFGDGKRIGDRASFLLGANFSSGKSSAGDGFGFGFGFDL